MQENLQIDPSSTDSRGSVPPAHSTVVDWLAQGAATAPQSLALCFKDERLTYLQLDCLSNRIGDALARSGVCRGDRVGIGMERSIELVATVIGILKCGAAYVPLDPVYPQERLAMMQQDANLKLLLVHATHAARFAEAACPVRNWEDFGNEVDQSSAGHVEVEIDSGDTAYVIFTSGSTGRPKGIAMPHRALANLIEWQLARKTFRPTARVLQYSSISFDVSFQEIATTLASGGTLYLIDDADRRDPRSLLARLVDHKIERLFLPYVAMRSMIEAAHVVGIYPTSLKEVVTAGEQLRVDDTVRRFFDRIDGSSLDNQYGPSETHVITAHLLEGTPADWPDLPPIGRPLKNCEVYILDEDMRPVPDGESGELYLSGRNLALGYINRPEITSKVFITNPFEHPGGYPLLYRTGDLAKRSTNGSIDFLGRRDHQIKIRGYRIEPGEVNNAASSFPGIGQCLTHAVGGHDSILQLVTYFTVQNGTRVDSTALRSHLESMLPEHMVPAFLIELKAIPYTPSGKVDLKALPTPKIKYSQYAHEDCAYRSGTEEVLAEIWTELLGLEKIPRSAGFFDLGGDSLRAVTLFLRIQQRFGRELPLSSLAHAPTIARLTELIEGGAETADLSGYRSLQLLKPGAPDEVPLFLIHGGKGNVLAFRAFAEGLDARQPVYAFQWSGWDGHQGERTIPDMARAYAAEIKRFLNGSRCRLGGNCIGGLIAIELARLLKRQGIAIDGPLVIWDAPNLHSTRYLRQEPWNDDRQLAAMKRVALALQERTPMPPDQAIVAEPEPCSSGLMGVLQGIPYLRRIVQWSKIQRRLLPAYAARLSGRQIPMDLREHYCIRLMLGAVRKYVCEPCTEDILYIRSHSLLGRDIGIPGWWDDLYLGFEEICNGHFETHVVGLRHNKVTEAPEIARIVNEVYGHQSQKQKERV